MESRERLAFVALGGQSKINHQNGVLFYNSDQQNDSDNRNHREFGARDHERQQCAHARRGQRRKNRNGMNITFIKDSQHQVNRNERGGDQQGFAAQRILIGLGGSGETRTNGRGQANLGGPLR